MASAPCAWSGDSYSGVSLQCIRALAEESKYPEIREQLLTIAALVDRVAKQYDKGLRRPITAIEIVH